MIQTERSSLWSLVATTAALASVWLASKLLVFLFKHWQWRRAVIGAMARQGIRGPPCNLLDGNYREIKQMQAAASSTSGSSIINHDIMPRAFPFQHKYSQLYGDNFLHWWGQDPTIYVSRPEQLMEIMSLKFGHCEKSPQIRRAMRFLFGKGLLVSTGEDWVRQRHVVNAAMTMEKIKSFVPVITDCAQALVHRWEDTVAKHGKQAEIDVKWDLVDMATTIILKCSFGDGVQYEIGRKYPGLAHKLLSLNKARSWPFSDILPSFIPTEREQLLKQIDDCFRQVIEAGRDEKEPQSTILSSMLSSNKNLSVQQIIDECKNVIFAGHETVAHMLAWTMMLLGLHPEWQQKMYQEVFDACNGRPPTLDMLNKFKIMNMVFNESLRLYPPGAQTARQPLKDMKLGDICVPKGVSVAVNVVQVHRNVEVWGPDALEFKPERFAEGVANACKQPVGGYLPFLLGPRVCVGQGLALLEARITMAILLQRLSWQLSPSYRHAPFADLTLQPQHGMQLLMSPRSP